MVEVVVGPARVLRLLREAMACWFPPLSVLPHTPWIRKLAAVAAVPHETLKLRRMVALAVAGVDAGSLTLRPTKVTSTQLQGRMEWAVVEAATLVETFGRPTMVRRNGVEQVES